MPVGMRRLLATLLSAAFAQKCAIHTSECTCADIYDLYDRNGCCAAANATIETSAGTTVRGVGGTLYVYEAARGLDAWSHVVDLAANALASEHGACAPAKTPHMVIPQPVAAPDYVAVTYTADRHVHILDAHTRRTVLCFDVAHVAGAAIHDGMWHHHGGAWYFVMVDMTGAVNGADGGGGLHAFRLDLVEMTATHTSSWSAPAALSLPASHTKPISAGAHAAGGVIAVTDANFGGAYFVQLSAAGQLGLVGHVPYAALVAGGCAADGAKLFGLWLAPHPRRPESIVAVFGQQIAGYSCLVDLNTQTLAADAVVPLSPNGVDAHGIGYCVDAATDALYLLITHRVSATMDIVDDAARALVRQDIDLNALFEGSYPPVEGDCAPPGDLPPGTKRFQPDVFSMRNRTLLATARGRRPLSAVLPNHWLEYAAPGMYATAVSDDCLSFAAAGSLPILNNRTVTNSGDPHGGRDVGDQFWLIDQSPTRLHVQRGTSWYLDRAQLDAFEASGLDTFLFFERAMLPEIPCRLAPPSAPPSPPLDLSAPTPPPAPKPPPPVGGGGMGGVG